MGGLPLKGLNGHVRARRGWRRLFVFSGLPDFVHHDVTTPRWSGPPLSIALLSDFHTMSPWNGLPALEALVEQVNALPVDLILLLGDYIPARPTPGLGATPEQTAEALAGLKAPLGVHAVLGNHDWRDDDVARNSDYRESGVLNALTGAGHSMLLNDSIALDHHGFKFWLVGYDSQQGHKHWRDGTARHDPERAFRDVPEDAPAILMAHEPDCFALRNPRALLQLSGHTHGGQANFFGWRPLTPSEYSDRYAYGHVQEDGHHLVVSGGIGYSHVPLRIAQPPEVTLVTLRGDLPETE
ncbi:metallophosphoesterase [Oceaniglobus trochenteri]|uniref:metallophosphoesterase n=1 Tax=Oceaniglobus trochenteri TaxID=2763260 RepID=UPI001D000742|nr:metallophosphoesterase [Oceaniglobus trochenteri]